MIATERKHSGLGIASFAISLIAGIGLLILVAELVGREPDTRLPVDPPDFLRYAVRWTDAGVVFAHPDARGDLVGEMFVQKDQPILIDFESTEPRDFAIPAFRIERHIAPGKRATIVLEAMKLGTYEILHRRSGEEEPFELLGYVHVVE